MSRRERYDGWLLEPNQAISNDPDRRFREGFVKFELDALLRPAAAARAEVYAKALDPATGWMRRDEVRRLEDLERER